MTRRCIVAVIALMSVTLGCRGATTDKKVQRVSGQPADYWPTAGWRETTPERQGMSSHALAMAVGQALEKGLAVHNLLIVRHGAVVLDANFYPFAEGRHDIASITKSVTSLLIGAAIERRILPAAETPLFDVLPNPAPSDSRKRAITLANLLGMRSGFACGFEGGEPELRAMTESQNWVQSAIDLPMRSAPGTEFGYCSPNYHLLSAVITARTKMPELAFARQALFEPLGISDVVWPVDPSGLNHGWGDLQLRPRDLAKLGYLMLHNGEWAGHRLLPSDWVEWSTQPRVKSGANTSYGHGWWIPSSAPQGFFEGVGRGGQRLSVWPEKDIIVVMMGGGFSPDDISQFLVRSIVADTALAPNPDGEAKLRASIVRAAEVPAPRPVKPPACASALSGASYSVDRNSMDLRSFTLAFPSTDSTVTRLQVGQLDLTLPVGMDGVYRKSPVLIDGIAPVARGTWRDPCQFVLDLNLVGKIDRYTVTMTFDTRNLDHARVSVSEATGLVQEETSASRR